MFWVGLFVGILWVVSLILAFAAGYGWNKQTDTDEEEK